MAGMGRQVALMGSMGSMGSIKLIGPVISTVKVKLRVGASLHNCRADIRVLNPNSTSSGIHILLFTMTMLRCAVARYEKFTSYFRWRIYWPIQSVVNLLAGLRHLCCGSPSGTKENAR